MSACEYIHVWKVRYACQKRKGVIIDLSFCTDAVPCVKLTQSGQDGSVMTSIVKMLLDACTIASRLLIWSRGAAQNEIIQSDPPWLYDVEFSSVSFWTLCFQSVSCWSRHSSTCTLPLPSAWQSLSLSLCDFTPPLFVAYVFLLSMIRQCEEWHTGRQAGPP